MAAVAALVAATAGCSTPSNNATGHSVTSAPPVPSSSAPASQAPISVSTVATFPIQQGSVGPLALDDTKVAFPFSDDGSESWTKVAVGDLGTQQRTVVAGTIWSRGFINWVAVTGDWVAWVDQSGRQSDADPKVLWRVWALNLSTGKKQQLASNANTPDPFVPQVHAADGYVFWTQAEQDRSARELAWKTGTAAPRQLLRHVEMTPGSESAAEDQLVYLSHAAGSHHGHTVGGDCWSVPLGGGTPKPLTHTALAMGCDVTGDRLVWTQHIDPHQKPMPSDGVLDDPYMVVSSKVDGSERKVLHRGYLSMGYPTSGQDFTVLPVGNSVLIQAISSPAHNRLPGSVIGPSVRAGSRDQLAFTTGRGGLQTIRVVSVSVRS